MHARQLPSTEPRTGRQPGCSDPDAADRSERRYRSAAGGHEHRKQGPHRRRRSQARRNRRTGAGGRSRRNRAAGLGSGTVRGRRCSAPARPGKPAKPTRRPAGTRTRRPPACSSTPSPRSAPQRLHRTVAREPRQGRRREAAGGLLRQSAGHPRRGRPCRTLPAGRVHGGRPGGPVPARRLPAVHPGRRASSVFLDEFTSQPETVALYDLQPPAGRPGRVRLHLSNVPIRLDAHVVHEDADGGEYRVSVDSLGRQRGLRRVRRPADPVGGAGESLPHPRTLQEPVRTRRRTRRAGNAVPRPTRPTARSRPKRSNRAPPTQTSPRSRRAVVDSWERRGALDSEGSPSSRTRTGRKRSSASPRVDRLRSAEVRTGDLVPAPPAAATEHEAEEKEAQGPTDHDAARSAFGLHVPAELHRRKPGELASPRAAGRDGRAARRRDALAVLGERAGGLHRRTDRPRNRRPRAAARCASQVGKVTIVSQLLEKPLEGRVYVGEPECSPCDSDPGRRRQAVEAVHRSRRLGRAA